MRGVESAPVAQYDVVPTITRRLLRYWSQLNTQISLF